MLTLLCGDEMDAVVADFTENLRAHVPQIAQALPQGDERRCVER